MNYIVKISLTVILFSIFNLPFTAFVQGSELDPLNEWNLRHPKLPCLSAITYGNGTYVAVGSNGAIMTSRDGINWTRQYSGTNEHLFGVAYGNGVFVVTGNAVTLTSTNGFNWTLGSWRTWHYSLGLSYVNGIFMSVGKGGAIHTSPDGITWAQGDTGTSYDLYGCSYGNGRYVAVGTGGTIRSSVDAVDWTGMEWAGSAIMSVVYGDNKFVAVGGRILSSTNGTDWLEMEVPEESFVLRSVTYANGLFVAVGDWGKIYTSAHGTVWVKQSSAGKSAGFLGIAYGAGLFTAVAGDRFPDVFFLSASNTLSIQTSPDGAHWMERNNYVTDDWLETVTYGNGMFVAASSDIVTSSNGRDWTLREQLGSDVIKASAFGNGIFVLAGIGIMASSHDGITWNLYEPPSSNTYIAVTFGNGLFVMVRDSGIFTSTDGIGWIQRFTGTTESFRAVSYGNNVFVAVGSWDGYYGGYKGTIITSYDGVNWTKRISRTNNTIDGIAYGNGTFIALMTQTPAQAFLRSNDGINWIEAGNMWAGPNIAFGKDAFVVVGPTLEIYSYKINENKSIPRPPPTTCFLEDVVFGDGTFVAVGSSGCILQSGNINDPQIQVTPSTLNFGYIRPGSYKDIILTVKNIGGMTLTGTLIACPPFSIVSGGDYSLGAGQSQVIVLRYTAPLQEGSHTCSLVFTGGGGITIQVKGTNKNVGLPWLQLLLGD